MAASCGKFSFLTQIGELDSAENMENEKGKEGVNLQKKETVFRFQKLLLVCG